MPRVFLYTSFCSTSSWEGERKEESMRLVDGGREMEGEGWMERPDMQLLQLLNICTDLSDRRKHSTSICTTGAYVR